MWYSFKKNVLYFFNFLKCNYLSLIKNYKIKLGERLNVNKKSHMICHMMILQISKEVMAI